MMATDLASQYIEEARRQMRGYKRMGDGAMAQLRDDDFFLTLDPEANSVAILVKHLAGNMRSRFTDFLTSRGPGLWSGQSGKELVLAEPFLHPETERQATEVGRYGSGVWLEHRSLAWSQVPCAEQWLTVG